MNLSWSAERQTLSVNSLTAVVVGVDALYPVFLGDATPSVGDLYNIEKLLADVGGDDKSCWSSLGLLSAEYSVGPLLGPGGGGEVGVIVLVKDIDGELERGPIKGVLDDSLVGCVLANGPGPGGSDGVLVLADQNDVACAVGVTGILASKNIFGEGFLAAEDELVGDEGEEFVECSGSLSARGDGEVGVEVIDGGGLGLGWGVGEIDTDSG